MPIPPDRQPGAREEEEVLFENLAAEPTEEGAARRVQGKGLRHFVDGVARAIGTGRTEPWQFPVMDKDLATPPVSPTAGDRYLIPSSATGDWTAADGQIAQWNGSSWVFSEPFRGMVVYVEDESEPYKQTAQSAPWSWSAVNSGGAGGDEKVKVSSNDTTSGYLNGKLVAGRLIALTEQNDGGDESLEVKVGLHATNHEEGGDDEMDVTDLSGRLADAQNADELQGRDVSADAPTASQVLTWRGSEWGPEDPTGSGGFEDLYEDEDATTRSTTTTGFDLAHRMTTGALSGGRYRVSFYYTWRHSAVSNDFKARVLVDGTQVHYHQQEPKDQFGDQYAVASGFAYVTLTTGAKNIDLEFGSSVSSQTSYIFVSRLEIWKVS